MRDADAAVGQHVGVVAVVEADPEVVVAADRRAVAVLVDDPVAAPGLVGDVVHHREVRACRGRSTGPPGVAVLAVASASVPSVMQMVSPQLWSSPSLPVLLPQKRTLPCGERAAIDVDVLGPVVAGQLEASPRRRAGSRCRRLGDRDPGAEAGVRALAVVGVAAALAEAQAVDAAGRERRLARS